MCQINPFQPPVRSVANDTVSDGFELRSIYIEAINHAPTNQLIYLRKKYEQRRELSKSSRGHVRPFFQRQIIRK